ncbi:MAG: carbohydrate porin [Candidatus Competibacteraceae bacterium]
MQNLKRLLPVAAVAVALGSSHVFAFEFNGYMRAGVGGNSDGGRQVCFKAPGASAKYRLGNECEVYGEYALSENLYKAEDGAYFKVHGLFAFSVSGYEDYEKDAPAFREWWIESGNVIGGIFEGARFWAGKRFYRREDVHINDFYYWGQGGRTGAGFENMKLGFGQAAVAYFVNSNSSLDSFAVRPVDPQTGEPLTDAAGQPVYELVNGGYIQNSTLAVNSIDMRLYQLKVNPGGQLTVGVEPRFFSDSNKDYNHHNGVLLNLLHFQEGDFLGTYNKGGYNKLALQFGNGVASTLADYGNMVANASTRSWRVVEQLVFQPTNSFSGMWALIYEHRNQDTQSNDPINWWFSTGIRPKYYFTDYTDVSLELGYDKVNPRTGGDRNLFKVTLAPEISAGRGFFARPALRVFATYAHWNKAAREAGVVLNSDGSIYEGAFNGWTWGVQAESWW